MSLCYEYDAYICVCTPRIYCVSLEYFVDPEINHALHSCLRKHNMSSLGQKQKPKLILMPVDAIYFWMFRFFFALLVALMTFLNTLNSVSIVHTIRDFEILIGLRLSKK